MYESDDNVQKPKDIRDILGKQVFQKGTESLTEEAWVVDRINTLSMYSIIYHGYTPKFNLKPVSILLLAIITTYSLAKRMCWHSQESLAKLTGSTIPTVIKNLKILESHHLIERGPPHQKYRRIIQWRLGPEGERVMEEIQKRVGASKRTKGGV